jgi:hypothetical protein
VPWLRILVLAFALLHATGASDAIEAVCGDACKEDCGDDEGCPPLCVTCHAAHCPSGVVAARVAIEPPPPRTTAATFEATDDAAPSPDPRDILHVPIAGV